MSWYNEHKTGDLMARFTNDLGAVRQLMGMTVISAFDATVMLVLVMGSMIRFVSLKLTLISGGSTFRRAGKVISHFEGTDVENTQRAEWTHSHEDSERSDADFGQMRQAALQNALNMIGAAFRYIFTGDLSLDKLQEIIGSRSYLSGLPTDDPRNTAVSFLLPPQKAEKKRRP